MHSASCPWVFRSPVPDGQAIVARMVEWSQVSRKQGLLGLESMHGDEKDEFIRKGLQLVIDGSEPDAIRGILEVELQTREAADIRAAKVFEGMGVYAPTLGIIGAVLGLMAVMQNPPIRPSSVQASPRLSPPRSYGIGLATCSCCPLPTSSRPLRWRRARSGR